MSVRLIILKMLWKQKIVHFLEQAGEGLKLAGTPIWHAIQLLNILENFGPGEINRLTYRSWPEAKRIALSLLDITSKLHGEAQTQLQHYVPANPSHCQNVSQIQLMRKYQLIIMSILRWKLASPLLIDEVSAIAHTWKHYTRSLKGLPIILQQQSCVVGSDKSQLSRNTRICLYNLSHLIKGSPIESISQKIRWLSLAIFFVTIKNTLGSKFSLNYILNDFIKKIYSIASEEINQEKLDVAQVLGSYELFRERSRAQKDYKKSKPTHKSKRQSEDKQNIKYYVNKQKKSAGKTNYEQGQKDQRFKSRSRSRKQGSKDLKGFQAKDSVLTKGKKKSNSAKSLFQKQNILFGSEQEFINKKKSVKLAKNKASKINEKSQTTSKILPNSNIQMTTKSTFSLKANPKKSNHSSIRMKLR